MDISKQNDSINQEILDENIQPSDFQGENQSTFSDNE